MQDELQRVVGDIGDVATDAAQSALASARDIGERAYRFADEARETVTEEVEDWTEESLESVRKQLRSQPMVAVVVSMLPGTIVGAILSRW